MRLYWPAVRVALRRTAAAIVFLGAVLAGVSAGWTLTHREHPPACVITGFSPGPNGHPAYTYSPPGCVLVNNR
jgi:hypothetical protein